MVIDLQVRRFLCVTAACARRTFVEQIAGLTQRFARRSLPLRKILEAIGLALAGRAGARLARILAIPAGANTLLRLIRARPEPSLGRASRVLGADDCSTGNKGRYRGWIAQAVSRRTISRPAA